MKSQIFFLTPFIIIGSVQASIKQNLAAKTEFGRDYSTLDDKHELFLDVNQGSSKDRDILERIVDLSHPLSMEGMPENPSAGFLEMSLETKDEGFGAKAEFHELFLDERLGTHINSPKMYAHLGNNSYSTDQIPLKNLFYVSAVIVDLSHSKEDRAPQLKIGDLKKWESQQGKIPEDSVVILRTGWSAFYGETDRFWGFFSNYGGKQTYPGFSTESVRWLIEERKIVGLATECVDVELPGATNNQVKQMLAIQNKYSLVQLANLQTLPRTGLRLIVSPLKLAGGRGGPARVYAIAGGEKRTDNENEWRWRHQNDEQQTIKQDGRYDLLKFDHSKRNSEGFKEIGVKSRSANSASKSNLSTLIVSIPMILLSISQRMN